jgi:hypothetical protein
MKNLVKLVWIIVMVAVIVLAGCESKEQKAEKAVESKQKYGYDQVEWGASFETVRRIYNISDDVQAFIVDSNDPNIVEITQVNVSDSITKRAFLFNKWNANDYQLYRVWVYYKTETDNNTIGQELMDLLTSKYGSVSTMREDPPKREALSLVFGSIATTETSTSYIWDYSPDLTVEYILEITNERKVQTIYGSSYWESNTFKSSVCYTDKLS